MTFLRISLANCMLFKLHGGERKKGEWREGKGRGKDRPPLRKFLDPPLDSIVAAMADTKYKVAFWRAQWVFSV